MSQENKERETQNYAFFQHRSCESFPCHKGVPEEDFNCLFCYCPLYALGPKCGGNFTYTARGLKNCINCTFPHRRENFDKVIARYAEVADLAADPPGSLSNPSLKHRKTEED